MAVGNGASGGAKRARVADRTALLVWARSAGRCAMCASSLLDSEWGLVTVSIGELAHNVGATSGEGSPRGNSPMPVDERNREENLLLLCHACHRKVDAPENQGVYTVEVLRQIKKDHEDMVSAATDFASQHRTLVVVTDAVVRDSSAKASHRQIAQALVASRRAPYSVDGRPVRVTINLADPETDPWVWERGRLRIDEAVAKIRADTEPGHVDHVSVFALAPIPLLVYLGHVLDDKISVDVYRRARDDTDRAWCWPTERPDPPEFVTSVEPVDANAAEAVVLVSISGSVSYARIPESLKSFPRVDLRPSEVVPNLDCLNSPEAVVSFGAAWRGLLGRVEHDLPRVDRLHVFAAVPAPAAVAMGRYRSRSANPALVIYQRNINDTYSAAMEVDA